jgi:hypothetical protein
MTSKTPDQEEIERSLVFSNNGMRKVEGLKPNEGEGIFSVYLILPAALGPGVYSQPLIQMCTRSRKIRFLGSRV